MLPGNSLVLSAQQLQLEDLLRPGVRFQGDVTVSSCNGCGVPSAVLQAPQVRQLPCTAQLRDDCLIDMADVPADRAPDKHACCRCHVHTDGAFSSFLLYVPCPHNIVHIHSGLNSRVLISMH